jgi:hypothetical protein
MGRVYLAHDTRLGRHVALKAVAPALAADPTHRDRLRREARAAAALTHPGICTVYALEEFGDDLFIAAEYVDGHTLRDEMKRGQQADAADVVRTASELAVALAHAHGRGVVHRDLKPENIMRTSDGRVKILDFGLALIDPRVDGRDPTHVTQPGTMVGTPRYMAPEQLNGQPATARSDVFAFGVLLYEYACGTHPFAAPTPLAVAGRILEGHATPLRECRPDLPHAVTDAIDRCLQKAPEDRFASGADLVPALDASGPAKGVNRMSAWWQTHQLIAVALYFIACGLAWQIKEWQPGIATTMFVIVGVAATVAGVFRGHLLFTVRVNSPHLAAERRRAMPVTLATDLLLALTLAADGVLLSASRPLAGVLTLALAIGIALARIVVEPATTSATFRTS